MSFYLAMNTFHDLENGIVIPRGTLIKTEEDAWVARFGKALRIQIGMTNVADDVVLIEVKNTVEGRKAAAEAKQAEVTPAIQRKRATDVSNKLVEGQEDK